MPSRWMAAARDGQLSDGTTVDSRLLTVGSADGCPSSGGGAPCSTPGQPHPSSSGSNGGGVRHGSHGALLTTSVSSMHLSVASANVPRHKPPALDLDRTRVRKDAQLFLSSITFSGTHPHSRNPPHGENDDAGPAESDDTGRTVNVQMLQRMRAAKPAYLHQSRISLTGASGTPFITYSLNPFSTAAESRRRQDKRTATVGQALVGPVVPIGGRGKRGGRKGTQSYYDALGSSATRYAAMDDDLLDAPEIGQGKHQKVLKLPSYIVTVVLYVKPEELKKDLNEMWAEKHPDIVITLSKFRSIKREMVEMGVVSSGLELGTVALAHVYFEHLVSTARIGKPNRKLVAAACLVIATKFWEPKDWVRESLLRLFRAVQDRWQISRSQILAYEFPVYAELNFDLHVAPSLVLSRMERLAAELPEEHPDFNIAEKPILDTPSPAPVSSSDSSS
eukprot:m.203941 g.203941  ORF g.203941 m.203941 type:complete len:448 (-) comp25297_c0_seq1:423-1766(-)